MWDPPKVFVRPTKNQSNLNGIHQDSTLPESHPIFTNYMWDLPKINLVYNQNPNKSMWDPKNSTQSKWDPQKFDVIYMRSTKISPNMYRDYQNSIQSVWG